MSERRTRVQQLTVAQLVAAPPPQAGLAEESCVGALLVDPAAYEKIAGIVGPGDIHAVPLRLIFEAVAALVRRQVEPDLVTVADELTTMNLLVEVGGASFLAELVERTPTAANVVHHARIVKHHAIRRAVMQRCTEVVVRVSEDNRPLPDYLPELLAPLATMPLAPVEPQPLAQTVVDAVMSIEAVQEKRVQPAVSTGWTELDELLGGWFPGYIVAAARTSVGKSSFALATALAATMAGVRADYFSLELPSDLMAKRALAQLSGVGLERILRGTHTPDEHRKVIEAADRLSALPLTVHEDWQRLWPNVQTQIRRAVLGEGSKLIVVDYLGLMRMPEGKGRSLDRRDVIGGISHDLKALANFLKVPILAPVQINREVGKEKDHRPKIWMLRDSGDIEQDAGLVLLLHRPSLYDAQEPEELCEVIVAKNSNGPLGKRDLYFNAPPMSFHNWSDRPATQAQRDAMFRYEGAQ